MIDTDKYGNEKRNWKVRDTFPDGASVDVELGWVYEDIVAVKGNGHRHYTVAQMVDTGGADALLIADAPLLLAEVKRLREEINQLPIDLHESLDMILEAHHPEVRESVMVMFGDAWGNNLTGYEE